MRWLNGITGSGNMKHWVYVREMVKDREAWCPWGHRELDRTEWLNKNKRSNLYNGLSPSPPSPLNLSSLIWEGNGNPLQYSCLENSMDRGAWQVMVHGVTKNSQTWLNDEHLSYSSLPCSSHLAGADWPLNYNFHLPSTLPPQRLYLAHTFSKWCLANAFTSFKSLLNFDLLNRAYTCHTI